MKHISKIYVAAASADMDRVREWSDRLKLAGLTVTGTWLEVIATVGDANPRDASQVQRCEWSMADLGQVRDADLVWFMVPPASMSTRGGWLEVGFAEALEKVIVFSGDTKQSIFCAIGGEFDRDGDAFAHICKLAREGVRG